MQVENNDIFPRGWSLINNLYESKVNYMKLIYFPHPTHQGENFAMIFVRIVVFSKGFNL
jgi:hypothetical protein